ncbi:MAG: SURF1 family protein [Sphingopyxis sp.]|nr:SURF1 family protein [Sphingopyxis sp.]
MVALGVWQLQRKGEKEAMIALHQRNIAMSSEVIFPELGPVDEALYFRRATVTCLEPISFAPRAGQDAKGASTYRTIVDCRTGAEGPGVQIAVGTHPDPARKAAWKGGTAQGIIVPGPDQPSLLDRLTGRAVPARALLVADPPVPGWGANARPAPDQQPNNHLAYAVQWFLFAAAAAAIYTLAVRKRLRG